jgi:hypothetical protein
MPADFTSYIVQNKAKKGKVFSAVNQLNTTLWRQVWEWRHCSTIPALVTNFWWVVSFTPRSLFHVENRFRYPLARRLGGSQSLFGRRREEKYFAATENRTPIFEPVARSTYPVSILTNMSRLYCSDYPHLFCSDFLTNTRWLVCFDPLFLNIFLWTMAYAYSIRNNLESLWLKYWYCHVYRLTTPVRMLNEFTNELPL